MKQLIFSHSGSLRSKRKTKYFFTGSGILWGLSAKAQDGDSSELSNTLSLFSNTTFDVLLGIIILLMIVIIIFGWVLKNVAESTKVQKKNNNGKMAGVIVFILFVSSSQNANAETTIASIVRSIDMPLSLLIIMKSIIALEVLVIYIMVNSINLFTKKQVDEVIILPVEPSFFEKINASVALEKENEIMSDHHYDGIYELDNDLPPWWKYGFLLTIVVAILYMLNQHVFSNQGLQLQEYDRSMQMAAIAKDEYQKMNANNVNESSVTLLTDKAEIAKGETIFKENCFACHGKYGEGGVGPNLTDDYWLHGGSIKDVFISVKYGWPDKGMKSWQADFSPVQIHQIASYIKTLNGSNPANPKEKQGELYTEIKTVIDSVVNDNTLIISKIDGAKDSVKKL